MGCIYGFFDRNAVVFYVGQTVNFESRMGCHKTEAEKGNRLFCYNKLRKEMRETGLPFLSFVRIIENSIPNENLDEKEINYIASFRQQGYRLTNLTTGGRGSIGFDKETQQRATKKRKGHVVSEETRRKMSQARLGMKFSDEHKANLSKARVKRQTTAESRAKTSKTSKGHINIKRFKIISPTGETFITTEGMVKFCEEHGLTPSLLHKTIVGKRSHHKGWKAERIKENEISKEVS